MEKVSYQERRGEIEHYFDRTAADAWRKLTSDAKVSKIRETVRAGRDDMRRTLLEWLPDDLTGKRLLDAGCGTGALAVEAARRGADVVAIDVAPTLIEIARERAPTDLGQGSVTFQAGDMLDPAHGQFDHVVGMDSLIHYCPADVVKVLAGLADRTSGSILFTFAPRTVPLAIMHAVGRFFPRGDRSPAIEPVSMRALTQLIANEPGLQGWAPNRTRRIAVGFYTSQALELLPA
ncbi:magnesium protoporphyrin IX methyltransferase [Thiorhodococcus mannitoliphagus]|uniref:Magnesium protoporphyrin IX methyltransferase n=1 Tax=Thiorhodococcus mannitoliphagus TaxID=329406 RepID=A0A6P1DL17_9GAMM|nr:magnesium protoporphyrin IX methyltransferase [Thiorhodococcus mannitoliphagus]NEX18917.1 magnesium protoporphyrin IX methyltransferase [Thiorhodococcus mannitoliphagus]